MIENKLLLTTPTNPRKMTSFFDEKAEIITGITLISVDYPPLTIKYEGQNQKQESIFGKKTDQASMYDAAGLIIDVKPLNPSLDSLDDSNQQVKHDKKNRKVFIIGNDIVFMSNGNKKFVSINGHFDILPEELISSVYTNFDDLKSSNLEELEEILTLSKDETAIKAFKNLGKYFTTSNYEINDNIFNLIEHQDQAMAITKKVLLKKMVAWEIKD